MSVFSAMKLILTLKCEESTQLVSQSLDADLSRSERLAVNMHALICRSCRRFKKQLLLLQKVLCQDGLDKALSAGMKDITLSSEAKDRIQKALSNRLR